MHDIANAIFMDLINSQEASSCRNYLAQRKISPEMQETFSLGFAPDSWNTLSSALQKVPFSNSEIELSGLLQALGLAGSSMNAEAGFRLKEWLGASPLRPTLYSEACMLRAAWKTYEGFESMHEDLTSNARESQSLSCLNSITPPGWDSPAMITSLSQATHFTGTECEQG